MRYAECRNERRENDVLLRSNSTRRVDLSLEMEEYSENYWLNDEVPEECIENMFDWMFEKAKELEREPMEEEIRIIRSN